MTEAEIEQVRALMATPEWKTLDDNGKYDALLTIDEDAEVYQVSYCSERAGGQIEEEEYPCLEEALERAAAIYGGALVLYAGTYVEVIDIEGNSYSSAYAI